MIKSCRVIVFAKRKVFNCGSGPEASGYTLDTYIFIKFIFRRRSTRETTDSNTQFIEESAPLHIDSIFQKYQNAISQYFPPVSISTECRYFIIYEWYHVEQKLYQAMRMNYIELCTCTFMISIPG